MSSVVLGLSTILCFFGAFWGVTSVFEKGLTDRLRLGRLMRSVATESLGILLWTIAYAMGAKPALAVPALIISLAIGSTFGVFHCLLRGRIANQDTEE